MSKIDEIIHQSMRKGLDNAFIEAVCPGYANAPQNVWGMKEMLLSPIAYIWMALCKFDGGETEQKAYANWEVWLKGLVK